MTLAEVSLAQFWLAALGAFLVGLAKGGLPGVGNLTVAIFALTFPAKVSVGILLPVLLTADLVAVAIYRKHADWQHILKLFPLAASGVVVGWLVFGRIDDRAVQLVIGSILLGFTALHFARKWWLGRRRRRRLPTDSGTAAEELPVVGSWFVVLTGLTGGFATMVANAAGPVAALYLMAVGLPKYAFIGTAAWFWLLINIFKIPFHLQLGNIDWGSLQVSGALAGFGVIGALTAPLLVRRINQIWFERLIWFFILLAGIRLLA
jgi:uncharacterized membrane protein YfcA